MSFRTEEKIKIDNFKINEFLLYIYKLGASKIYPDREVSSIYFDNNFFDMYHQSIEGVLPRKKIRTRYYNQKNREMFLEMKINSFEGRFKTSEKLIDNKIFKFGIFDREYGRCFPKIKIKYNRSYFKFKKLRITIDQNIIYKKFLSFETKKDKNSIVEIKGDYNLNFDYLRETIPFERIRFSKYSNSVEKCIKI